MGVRSELPLVRIPVLLGGALAARAKTDGIRDSIGQEVRSRTQALLQQLGVPGTADVEVTDSSGGRPIRILLNDRYRCASKEILLCAWKRVGLGHLFTPPVHGFANWLDQSVSQITDEAMLVQFVGSVCRDVVCSHPEELFGLEHASYLFEQCSLLLDSQRREAIGSTVHARVVSIVRPVLSLKLSLNPVTELLKTIVEGWAEPDDVLSERLISRRVKQKIQIGLAPQKLRRLFPKVAKDGFSLHDPKVADNSKEIFGRLRDRVFFELGVRIPEILLFGDRECNESEVRLVVNDVPGEALEWLLTDSTKPPQRLADLICRHFKRLARCFVTTLPAEVSKTPLQRLADLIFEHLKRLAWCFMTTDVVETELALFEEQQPALTLAVARKIPSAQLARVLRTLVRESVSIRDFSTILERLLTFDKVTVDTLGVVAFDDRLAVHRKLAALDTTGEIEMGDYVRLGLRRSIVLRYSQYLPTICTYMLDQAAEEKLLDHAAASRGASNGEVLSPEELDQFVEAVLRKIEVSTGAGAPAIVTEAGIRWFVRDLIADELPHCAVLSYDEIDQWPEISVQVLGSIEWPASQKRPQAAVAT